MNTVELTHKLFEMGRDSDYPMNTVTAIVNAIVVQYLTKAGYMEEDAIRTMNGFLSNGTLIW